jgi:hypothetical protein
MVYRSPFITETDEPAWTDCKFASGLMLVAEWTAGEAIHDRHGNTLDAKGLKRLRERIRVLSGDSVGGASLEDLARGIAKRFPDLPPLPRTTAPGDPGVHAARRSASMASRAFMSVCSRTWRRARSTGDC